MAASVIQGDIASLILPLMNIGCDELRNVYAAEVNDPDDNPPIGIILCTEKDSVTAEYVLDGLSNDVFASRYVLFMPNKEQLVAQVEAVLQEWHEGE